VNSNKLFEIFTFIFFASRYRSQSRDSSLGLATGYGLDGGGIGVRFLAGSRDNSLLHSSGAYLAFCTMGTGGLFPRVNPPEA
jgi:hypothetical protein